MRRLCFDLFDVNRLGIRDSQTLNTMSRVWWGAQVWTLDRSLLSYELPLL